MKMLSALDIQAINEFLFSKGRDLEVALYQTYFENEDPEMVLHGLSIYQNGDGGFGHGLEPDCLNPNSSPIQTWEALRIMHSVGYRSDSQSDIFQKMIRKTFRYLYEKAIWNQKTWPYTIPSNNDYSCAVWWKYSEEKAQKEEYNPTAAIIAYTLLLAKPQTKYYQKALSMVGQAFDYYLHLDLQDKHELHCFITLIEALEELHMVPAHFEEVKQKIYLDAERIIQRDSNQWANYPNLATDLFDQTMEVPASIQELISLELDFIIESKDKNSLWNPSWTWFNEDPGWEASEIKWMGIIAIRNLRLLRKYGRMDTGLEA